VDGGLQRRSFTDVTDGISALVKIIENRDGVADSKIYNIGNPENDLSIKELANLMLEMSFNYPEYESQARNVNIVEVTSADYYGKGYQDIKSRVPYIGNTREELDWAPLIDVKDALGKIMDTYRHEVAAARALLK
jgi:nucleoside-diphosphate-sugar epimerase